MRWESLLHIAADEPLITSGMLLGPGVARKDVEKQLSRWTAAGKLHQVRRGLYALAAPYRKLPAHPFHVANQLRKPSYVSLQSALEQHGLIPEYVPVVTSVTTGRAGEVRTPLGNFIYRHVRKDFFEGYRRIELGGGQAAFIATPEKALLDLIYLTPGSDDRGWVEELRLQNLGTLEEEELRRRVAASGRPKLERALRQIMRLKRDEEEGYEQL